MFKAKWTILAKAYSLIREYVEKEDAPLDLYLAMCGPLVGLIPPRSYMGMLGWELISDGEHCALARTFFPDTSSFDKEIMRTDITVVDILRFCFDEEYILIDEDTVELHRALPTTQNIMVSQPSGNQAATTVLQGTFSAVDNSVVVHQGVSGTSQLNSTVSQLMEPSMQLAGNGVHAIEADAQDNLTQNANASTEANINLEANGQSVSETTQERSLEEVMEDVIAFLADQEKKKEVEARAKEIEDEKNRKDMEAHPGRDVVARFEAAGVTFPYTDDFHPNNSSGISFDPFEGDAFDTYNLAEYVEPEFL